jgi:hypothetical protein
VFRDARDTSEALRLMVLATGGGFVRSSAIAAANNEEFQGTVERVGVGNLTPRFARRVIPAVAIWQYIT